MKIRRMRNNVKLTDVIYNPGKGITYGFGVVLDGAAQPNFVFFPPRVVSQYEITCDDIGAVLDCVFRDDSRTVKTGTQDPVVVAIIEEDDPINVTATIETEELEGEDDGAGQLPEFVTRG